MIFGFLNYFGYLDLITSKLDIIIKNRPIIKLYFPVFILTTFIFPLILGYIYRSNNSWRIAMNSYIVNLFSQIISEFILVILLSKSMGVLIGFYFSSSRIYQLTNMISSPIKDRRLNSYLTFLLFMWSINLIQIVINRFIPYVYLK